MVLKAVEDVLFIHNEAGDVEVYLEPREITPYMYMVRAEVDAVVREEPVHAEAETEVRIQRTACDMCSRESGGYFEAIIQIRAAGRFPTEEEKKRSMTIAREAMTVKEGLDLAIRAIHNATKRDSASGENIDVVVITKEAFRRLDPEDVKSIRASLHK